MICCVWVTASLSPQLPLWTPHPSDSLDILKALCAVPAAFSPFIWVWFLAEPSNTEAGGENNRGQEEKSKMLTFIMCPLSPKITSTASLRLSFSCTAFPPSKITGGTQPYKLAPRGAGRDRWGAQGPPLTTCISLHSQQPLWCFHET